MARVGRHYDFERPVGGATTLDRREFELAIIANV